MKGLVRTASSSVKSSFTTTTMEDNRTETQDSRYYSGCRKDANCNCEICLDSINATLDLMPISIQKSSLTKYSSSRPNVERTPISFDPSIMSTPRSSSCRKFESTKLKPTAKMSFNENKIERSERNGGSKRGISLKLALILTLIFATEIGFSWVIFVIFRPSLSRDLVRNVGERSQEVQDLNGRLRFLQNELKGFVGGQVSNCSCSHSKWEINQDGLLVNSRCILYRSAIEEVSIWGWPLQTSGLLTTGFCSRSFTILLGRVTEWPKGKIGLSIRKENASWVQRKWGASVIQLDPNTWVLEYRQSSILENSRLFLTALELLKYRMSSLMRRMNDEFWLFSGVESQYGEFTAKDQTMIPT